ncbi:hypothetical protein GQF42_35030 [Streptomyces broussonetiae]|uniref:Uncharacterized protein n=1 Tax=Streptomyces broussonetiae TaxID=2686304 RepID=A0A6I6NBP1_9ACTN|nr:hypothetical protein [Streptomyces broussonetiae]QHA07821.1 hypothetical protein GQF42_35030 [Streptomyces broussonetiae]
MNMQERQGEHVTTGAERSLAIEHWLLMAAEDWGRARREWRTEGVTLLRSGGLFGVVRINAEVVRAAAGAEDVTAVDHFLAQALLGGPVFMDQELLRYYALVGASTGCRLEWTLARDDAEFMGVGHYLGVPALDATTPKVRRYWCVEMDSAGELAPGDAVARLVRVGRSKIARGDRQLGG